MPTIGACEHNNHKPQCMFATLLLTLFHDSLVHFIRVLWQLLVVRACVTAGEAQLEGLALCGTAKGITLCDSLPSEDEKNLVAAIKRLFR